LIKKKEHIPVGVVSSGPAVSIISPSDAIDKYFNLFQSKKHFYSLVPAVLA
jgi:hypothetical protein